MRRALALAAVLLVGFPGVAQSHSPRLTHSEVRRAAQAWFYDKNDPENRLGRCKIGRFHAWCRYSERYVEALPEHWTWHGTMKLDVRGGRIRITEDIFTTVVWVTRWVSL